MLEFAATLTDVGTVKPGLLLVKPTVRPVVGAAVSETVQELDAAPASEAGLHTIDESAGAGLRDRLAVCDTPFRLAVTVTVALTDPLLAAEN